jgi:hypothetical protein
VVVLVLVLVLVLGHLIGSLVLPSGCTVEPGLANVLADTAKWGDGR